MTQVLTKYGQVRNVSFTQLKPILYQAMETLALDFILGGTFLNEDPFITQRIHELIIFLKYGVNI